MGVEKKMGPDEDEKEKEENEEEEPEEEESEPWWSLPNNLFF